MKKLSILILAISMIGCTKESFKKEEKYFLNYNFEVSDQKSVSHYVIEVSTDQGNTFENAVSIPATVSEKYTIKIDARKWFAVASTVLSRIKEVDIDGQVSYSQVYATSK